MNLFYFDQGNLKQMFASGYNTISLSGDEAAHLRVLRLKPGEGILITDGLGNVAKAGVIDITNKSNTLQLTEVKSFGRGKYPIHIVVAPPKNIARFEWFLEKATEMGIDEITPIYSEHSERVNLRIDRLNKVIISAMKQSLKTFIPKLNDPIGFYDYINHVSENDNCFIAWLDKVKDQPHLKSVCRVNASATILIGPEGDFSEKEVQAAKDKGFMAVSLGSSRLRTETAALAACFIVNVINEPETSGYPISIE